MSSKATNFYIRLREQYRPRRIRAVFVLESPPTSGWYFYNPQGRVSEPLFRAMMRLLPYGPVTKEEGLRAFRMAGFYLVNATYTPMNGFRSGALRDRKILGNYRNLVADLRKRIGGKRTPIVLVKRNICTLLEPRLVADGFRVINRGQRVPFPSHGWQHTFHQRVASILRTV